MQTTPTLTFNQKHTEIATTLPPPNLPPDPDQLVQFTKPQKILMALGGIELISGIFLLYGGLPGKINDLVIPGAVLFILGALTTMGVFANKHHSNTWSVNNQ